MNIDDIRAAVAKGTITEAQAADIVALSQAREGYRTNLGGVDEPFELFRGFNEIMIVVGLGILFFGYWMVSGLLAFGSSSFSGILSSGIAIVAIFALSRYFTLTRRMIAPSIALTVMGGAAAVALGIAIAFQTSGDIGFWDGTDGFSNMGLPTYPLMLVITFAVTSAVLLLQWYLFRVPFAMALIGLSVLALCFSVSALGGAELTGIDQIFLLSGSGTFSLITVALGVLGFLIALRFDLSDPHRVTRRSAQAFWLHVIAAPAIINTVAVTLLSQDNSLTYAVLAVFLFCMAALAIIIDRRSFLLSTLGYIIFLIVILSENTGTAVAFTFFALGLGLVLLGAFWERIRRGLMNTLPDFPGKSNLPPWAQRTPS